jgi:hypothetical protein
MFVFKDASLSPFSRRKTAVFYYLGERPAPPVFLDVGF